MGDLWGSEARRRARDENADRLALAERINGRCVHGFVTGSGLCAVPGCKANGGGAKERTCFRCRRQHTGTRNGRLCDECAGRQRRKGEL
jgi:hypothetical protein